MAQVFDINGTTLTHITDANWEDKPEDDYLNGKTPVNQWRNVVLEGTMEETQFDIIYALEGQQVSVTIPPYDDRNGAFATYYYVILQSVTGDHQGPSMQNVRAELKVRI